MAPLPKKLMQYIIALAVCSVVFYPLSWLVSYIAFMGLDFRYLFLYWRLAWSGGGELPTFIQIAAVCLTFFLSVMTIVARQLSR
jgi:hypothetical protein